MGASCEDTRDSGGARDRADVLVDTQKLCRDLIGEWRVNREITGFPPLTGTASFTPTAAGLLYREEVQLPTPGGLILDGAREYLYTFEPGVVAIHFAYQGRPGELFMRLELEASDSKITAVSAHLCKADLYEGTFEFAGPDKFKIAYDVKGPAKAYRISTNFSR